MSFMNIAFARRSVRQDKERKDATMKRYSNEHNMAKRSANLKFAALIVTNKTPQRLVILTLKS